ncbi:nucleotide pyrophosphatase [Rhodococcus rhodnii]|uniref:Nucleotide pyrophosphatase n=1 Tax=Rhodococcus rhodnii TaxID=38312 RepID=A0A6P2CFI9_9NOCA|nr:alkaline phosphatase family protein [Rhodococcus rhodnii]TXG91122.1 nucleotide pyrophosphatase [Rhodococcus rhodnii]
MNNQRTRRHRLQLLLSAGALTLALAATTTGTAAASPDTAVSGIDKTVVIGLDGTMLAEVRDAAAPNLHRLLAEGASAEASIAGHPTISGPSWSTILTGVWHTEHGVVDNSYLGARFDRYPSVFTRIERERPELRTASIATWDGIARIATSGPPAADVVVTTPGASILPTIDARTATSVVAEIETNGPDFLFTQLDHVDAVGHVGGTNSPLYRTAIERVDVEVGRIVDAVDARRAATGENWTVLVVSDHGHTPTGGHGGQSPHEASTFVIARGDGIEAGRVNAGFTLADVTPTVLANLGLDVPAELAGTPVPRSGQSVPA